jgi:membrane protease YdiL (CAAX protease family)
LDRHLRGLIPSSTIRGHRLTLTRSRAKLPAWPTIIITTLLFAVGHLTISLGNILATVPLGLAAGYLRERTGSVRAPMAFHMLHNAAAVTVLLMKA